tara:strand:- start:290 stop:706 length:417 start_codon:yes stop_codon:yes gene_type:complete
MGTINVNLIADNGGSSNVDVQGEGSNTTNLPIGLNKAWCHWDMNSSGHPIYNSFNIASTADKANGETTVTFTNNMAGANWGSTFYANTSQTSGDGQFGANIAGNVGLRTTTGYIFESYNGSSMMDSKHCDAHTVGDLA